MTFARLLTLSAAAGLPLVISFHLAADPIAPKQALWMILGGLMLAARPVPAFRLEPATLFLLIALVLSFVSPVSRDALLPYLIGVIVFLRCRQEGRDSSFTLKYVRLAAAVAALVALYGITQAFWNRHFSQVVLVNPFGDRILSTLGNPTFLADYLAMHLPLGLVLASAARTGRGFGLWTLACIAMAAAIVFSGSKGGQLAALAAGAGWLLITLRHRTIAPKRFAFLLGLAAATLVPVLFLSVSSLKFSLSRWISSEQKFSFTQRLEISRGSSALLAQNPLLGAGPGSFPVLFPAFQPASLYRNLGAGLSVNHAHNDWLEIACETGIVGLGLILLVIVSAVRSALLSPLTTALALSVLAGAVSMGANFVFFLPSSAVFLWMNLGFLSAAREKSRPPRELPRVASAVPWLFAALLGAGAVRMLLGTGWFDLGMRSLEGGSHRQAEASLKRASLADPLNRHVLQHLGRAYELEGNLDSAREAYRGAARLGPNHVITGLNLARVAKMQYEAGAGTKALDEALAGLAGVVWVNPYQMEARIWGGELALKTGRIEDARRFLEIAPPDAAASAQWHRLRRTYFLKTGQKAAAAGELSAARRLELAAILSRAEDSIRRGDLAGAEKLAREAVRSRPDSAAALETLGFILHGRGELGQALDCYKKMLKLEPDNVVAHLNISLISLVRGDLDVARKHVERAMEIAPENPEAHLARARLKAREGDFTEAKLEYEWILKRNPEHPQAKSELKALPAR